MQIAWDAMQMRDLMQYMPYWEAGQDPPLINSGTRCWAEHPFLPGVPSLPSPSRLFTPPPAPQIPLHQYLPLEWYLSPPGPFLTFLSVPPFSMNDDDDNNNNNNNNKHILNTCSVQGFVPNTFHSYRILPTTL